MPKLKDLQKFTSSYAKDLSDNTIYGKRKKHPNKSFGLKDFRAILKKTTAVSYDSVPKKKSKVKRKITALSSHTYGERIKNELKNAPKKKRMHHRKENFDGPQRKKDLVNERKKENKLCKQRSFRHRSPRRTSSVDPTPRQQSPILRLSRRGSPILRLSRRQSPMLRQSSHQSQTPLSGHISPVHPVWRHAGSYTSESFEAGTKSLSDKPIFCPRDNVSEELNPIKIRTLGSDHLKQKISQPRTSYNETRTSLNVSRSDQYVVQTSSSIEKQILDAKTLRALINSSGSVDIDDNMVIKLLEESLFSAIKKGDIALADVEGGASSDTSSDAGSLKKLHYEEVVHSYSDTIKPDKKNVKVAKRSVDRPATVASTSHNSHSHKNLTSIFASSSKKTGYKQLNDILNPDLEIEDFFKKVQAFVRTFPVWLQTKAKKKIFNLVIGLDVYRRKYGRRI